VARWTEQTLVVLECNEENEMMVRYVDEFCQYVHTLIHLAIHF
jgi:hypothetical protein